MLKRSVARGHAPLVVLDGAGYRRMTPGSGSSVMESRLTLPLSFGPNTKLSGVAWLRGRLTWCSDQVSQVGRVGSRSGCLGSVVSIGEVWRRLVAAGLTPPEQPDDL